MLPGHTYGWVQVTREQGAARPIHVPCVFQWSSVTSPFLLTVQKGLVCHSSEGLCAEETNLLRIPRMPGIVKFLEVSYVT